MDRVCFLKYSLSQPHSEAAEREKQQMMLSIHIHAPYPSNLLHILEMQWLCFCHNFNRLCFHMYTGKDRVSAFPTLVNCTAVDF